MRNWYINVQMLLAGIEMSTNLKQKQHYFRTTFCINPGVMAI